MDAIIIYGLSGSGKTTKAKELWELGQHCWWVERDEIRKEVIPGFRESGWTEYNSNHEWESLVTHLWHRDLWEACEKGKDLIISDTLCKVRYRREVQTILDYLGYDVQYFRMQTNVDECIERDKGRGVWSVGEEVIRRQWVSLNKHSGHI